MLLQHLTAKQFKEWQLYADIEPWGAVESDNQNSYTRYIVATAFGGSKRKDGSRLKLSDFSMEEMRKEARLKKNRQVEGGQSVEEMKEVLIGLAKGE